MILADTSIWIDHIRQPVVALTAALSMGNIVQHPYVVAEISLGSIAKRRQVIDGISRLPPLDPIAHVDLLEFIETNAIHGTGLGFVDTHLLAACARDRLSLWTRDKRLQEQAERLGLAYQD